MANKVRMADIAQELGISVVSVSKGLAGKDGVSEEMRGKIIATAKRLGYVPAATPAAKATTVLNLTIGVLVADRFFADNAFYSSLYRIVLMKSAALGCTVVLEIVSPENESACRLPAILTSHRVDGLLLMGEINRDYIRAVAKTGLPMLLLDFYDSMLENSSVLSDNRAGGERLTSHLLAHGCRKIGFVGSILSTSSIMDRYLGYQAALYRAGIAARPDWRIEDRDENGRFVALRLPAEMPEAFLCSCDEVAYNLVEALVRAGYRVPEDVSVVGYDDYRFATLCTPALTTYRVNVEEMGAVAVAQLLRRIRRKSYIHGSILVRGGLIERESVRPLQK